MDTSVKIRCLNNAAAEMKEYSVMINRSIIAVEDIKNNLSFKIKYRARINTDLNTILNQLYAEKRKIERLCKALNDSKGIYISTENEIISNYGKNITKSGNSKTNQAEENSGQEPYVKADWEALMWKVLGSAGMAGTGISTIGQIIKGESDFDKGIAAGKGISKLIEQYINGNNSGAEWSQIVFGTNQTEAKSFIENLKSQFVKTKKVDGVKVVSKGATAAKWAGNLLIVADNTYDNYKEAGNKWTNRALSETAIESGVDIAISAGVGAAAGVAGGIIGAPAIAVAAGTAVAVWGLNEGWKQISGGKDIAESVSDFVLDTVIPKTQKAGKEIKKAISNGANKPGKSVKRAFSGVSSGWNKFATAW